jgi:glycosyltransferase involved in cell wall biosynthesis
MKICHITYDFPPTTGGVETHNYSLVKYLLKKGYDVDVIVLRSSLTKVQIAKASATVNKGIKLHDIYPKPFPFWIFQVRKEIKKIEKEGKIDVFDIHSTLHVLPLIFQKRKIVFSLHYFELNCPGPRIDHSPQSCISSFTKCWRCCGIKRFFEWKVTRYLAIKKTTKFMAKYDYMKKLTVKSGVGEDSIKVVPHWIDVEKNRKIMKNSKLTIAGVDEHNNIFVHVGRLAPDKGVIELLKAFNILIKKYKNGKLIFVGDGVLKNKMEDFCSKNNIDNNVIFTGAVKHDAIFKYLSITNYIVSCQLLDNYGWALLEYMCAEKPIITTNVGATSDILEDGYNALFAEPTVESLSMKMQEILENPKLAKKIAKNALETVRAKHEYGNLRKYEELIKEVVE